MLLENVRLKICKADSLPLVVCGFEIWSVTSREKHRLRVFENGAEEFICIKKAEGTGGCIKLLMREFVVVLLAKC